MADEPHRNGYDSDESTASTIPDEKPTSPRQVALIDCARDLAKIRFKQYQNILYHSNSLGEPSKRIKSLPEDWRTGFKDFRRWARRTRLYGYDRDSSSYDYRKSSKYDFRKARFDDQISIIDQLRSLGLSLIVLLKERESWDDGAQEVLYTKSTSTTDTKKIIWDIKARIQILEQLVQPRKTLSSQQANVVLTIKELYQRCLVAYAVTLDHLETAEVHIQQKLSNGAFEDQRDSLKEWAHETGVLSQGKDSLEYRMMYPGTLTCMGTCDSVCLHLKQIKRKLRSAIELIVGERIPWEDTPASDSNADSDPDSSSSRGITQLQDHANGLDSHNIYLSKVTSRFRLGNDAELVSPPNSTLARGRSLYTDLITEEPVILKRLEGLKLEAEEGTDIQGGIHSGVSSII